MLLRHHLIPTGDLALRHCGNSVAGLSHLQRLAPVFSVKSFTTPAPPGPGSPPPEAFSSVQSMLPPELLAELRNEVQHRTHPKAGINTVEELYGKMCSAGEHLGPVQVAFNSGAWVA